MTERYPCVCVYHGLMRGCEQRLQGHRIRCHWSKFDQVPKHFVPVSSPSSSIFLNLVWCLAPPKWCHRSVYLVHFCYYSTLELNQKSHDCSDLVLFLK